MRGRPAAVLFDLDGTLVDSERAICDAVSQAFADLGVVVAPSAVSPHLGAPLDELYDTFVGDDDDGRRRTFTALYIAHHDRHPEAHGPLFPTVDAAVRALARDEGIPLAVATTKPTHRARGHIVHHGLDDVIRHVQGTDIGMRPKPHPDVILHACRALGVDPASTWMIGDTARDVGAARAAGAKVAVVAWSDEARVRAKGLAADLVISSMEELVARVRGG